MKESGDGRRRATSSRRKVNQCNFREEEEGRTSEEEKRREAKRL